MACILKLPEVIQQVSDLDFCPAIAALIGRDEELVFKQGVD
jgi:hypothetical protein